MSAGKQSRALNVGYHYIADQVNKGNIQVKYCQTDEIIGDFMTKPLQGKKFFSCNRFSIAFAVPDSLLKETSVHQDALEHLLQLKKILFILLDSSCLTSNLQIWLELLIKQ